MFQKKKVSKKDTIATCASKFAIEAGILILQGQSLSYRGIMLTRSASYLYMVVFFLILSEESTYGFIFRMEITFSEES